jgi:hypothetical protein
MNSDTELLKAVRDSFAGARLAAPLDATIARGRRLRARRRAAGVTGVACAAAVAAGAGAGLAGALAASPATSPAVFHTPSPATGAPDRLAAWTVTRTPDGIVTILVRQLSDPAGLQRTLRADGVPINVRFQGGTLSDTPPMPRACTRAALPDKGAAELQGKILGVPTETTLGSKVALVVHTTQIPKGIGLNLTLQDVVVAPPDYTVGWSLGLVDATPACTG